MARSRGYWKRKNSRRQRRILNRSLDVILQVGTHRIAMAMAANLAARHLIGNRRELTRIEQRTQIELERLDWEEKERESFFDAHYEAEEQRQWDEYMRDLEADMRDQQYNDELWSEADMEDRYHYFD